MAICFTAQCPQASVTHTILALILQDLYTFCSFVLVLQLAIFTLYASRAAAYPVKTAAVVRRVIDTFIAAVPTGIPTIIIFSLGRCVAVLKGGDVEVHQALAVKAAAAVEAVVFDKTGTLTGSLVRMHQNLEQHPKNSSKFSNAATLKHSVACYSLRCSQAPHLILLCCRLVKHYFM